MFDKQKQEIFLNKKYIELLMCFDIQKSNGYMLKEVDIQDIKDLINRIKTWYEFKYSDGEITYYGKKLFNSYNNDLLSVMSVSNLLLRLPFQQLNFLMGYYDSYGLGIWPYHDKVSKKMIDQNIITIPVPPIKGPYVLSMISADQRSGKIVFRDIWEDFYIDLNIKNDANIYLGELLTHFIKYDTGKWDYSRLKCVIHSHNVDMEFRRKVLELVIIEILFSKQTTIVNGYMRAKCFITEFNAYFKDLNLTTDILEQFKIQEIYGIDDFVNFGLMNKDDMKIRNKK